MVVSRFSDLATLHRINKTEKYKSYFNFHLFFIKVKEYQYCNRLTLKMTTEKKAVDLGLLEEDDEFEEFPAEGMLQL